MDSWFSIASACIEAPFERRKVLVDSLEQQVQMWKYRLANEENKSLPISDKVVWESLLNDLVKLTEDLRGDDFSSRFRTAVTKPDHFGVAEDIDDEQTQKDTHLKLIVNEILNSPDLLNDQWTWLLSLRFEEQPHLWRFFEVLGSSDQNHDFMKKLLDIASKSHGAIMWHSIYQLSWFSSFSNDDSFDEWLVELRQIETPSELIFDLIIRKGYSPNRIELFSSMIQNKEIASSAVSSLSYHPWGPKIPFESIKKLLENILLSEPDIQPLTKTHLTTFLQNYLKQNESAIKPLQDVAIKLLTAPGEDSNLDIRAWANLAGLYVKDEPIKLTTVALQHMSKINLHHSGSIREFIEEAWNISDKQLLFKDCIAPAIGLDDNNGYSESIWLTHETLNGFPFHEAGVEFIMDWVRAQPDQRALALAEVLGAPHDKFPELHATLLGEFAEEGVSSAFHNKFTGGSWTGEMSDWAARKIELATI